VPVPSQPLHLRTGVPVGNIALVVLEAPGDDDEDISLTNPDLLLDLSLDPSHPGYPVKAPHPDMVCAHHEFGTGKYLAVPLVRDAYPDDLFRWSAVSGPLVGQYINSLLPCWFCPDVSKKSFLLQPYSSCPVSGVTGRVSSPRSAWRLFIKIGFQRTLRRRLSKKEFSIQLNI